MSTHKLLEHLACDFKIFLLEDSSLHSPQEVKVSWVSKDSPNGHYEFNLTLVLDLGPTSLGALERIAHRAEARVDDVLIYCEAGSGVDRMVLSKPIQWWVYSESDYGDSRKKELVRAMKDFAASCILEDHSAVWARRSAEETSLDKDLGEYRPVGGTGESD